MGSAPDGAPRPPRPLRLIAGLLIRGRHATYIVPDLEASFTRDVERGVGRREAALRYTWNVLGSLWSVWTGGLRGLVTHGIGIDAKLGLRMLVKQPLITAVALLALGLGIPGSLALLHGFDAIYSEFPVPDDERVVGIRHYDLERRSVLPSTVHDYERWLELASFASVGAARSFRANVNGEEAGAWPVGAAQITASAFEVLRARPLQGRVFDAADELDGAPDVVLIGEALWSARFARDPDIVGASIRVGRSTHTVVGVMPRDFLFPVSSQLWLPFRARAVDVPSGAGPRVSVFGRLADGVSIEDAEAEMAGVTATRASDDPERFEHAVGQLVDMPILLLNMREGIWNRPEVLLSQTLIFALLLVVCGNVGILILARTAARSAEITIRTALGASRARILTQLFVEALVLALTATGVGLIVANASATRIMQLLDLSGEIPYWADLTLTPRTVAIALGLAVLCAVVAGVVPALSTTRSAIQPKLQSAAARGGSTRFGVGSSVLIVGQIVLSVGFLALGGARARSSSLYWGRDLGFDPERYVVGTLTVPEIDPMSSVDSVAAARRAAQVQRLLLEHLWEDASVVGASMGEHIPGSYPPNRDVILGTPPVDFQPVGWDTGVLRVDVSFFSGLNRPVLAGRDFNAGDVEGPPGTRHTAVIVNESFVRDVLGGRNAVGQRLRYEPYALLRTDGDEEEWYEIVGVVGSFGTNPYAPARDAAIYHPLAPGEVNPVRYTVEVAGDQRTFVSRFRQIAASVDREATLDSGLLSTYLPTGTTFLIVIVFAGAAFLLSVTGLYALMSFTVSQRTREIGIRTALGARAADIVSAVARRAVLQVAVGLTLGVGWGWVLLDSQRNDMTFDVGNIPLTLAATAIVAACVCAVACVYPTLRGLRIEPTEAFRES